LKDSTENSAEQLDSKQEKALAALLSQPNLKKACAVAKISEVTMWRWLREPAFVSAYRAARRQIVENAVAHLQADCSVAVTVLREIAEDKEAPGTARVAAAKAILEQSIEAIQMTDMLERVEKIEAILAEQK
jgi:hypothetical protein